MKLSYLAIGATIVLVVAGISLSVVPNGANVNYSQPVPVENQDPVALGARIHRTENGYTPKDVTITLGGAVEFVNESSEFHWPASDVHPSHTLYNDSNISEHCPDENGTTFDACGPIAPGEVWSFTFKKSGRWNFHDHLRANFKGTITVEPVN